MNKWREPCFEGTHHRARRKHLNYGSGVDILRLAISIKRPWQVTARRNKVGSLLVLEYRTSGQLTERRIERPFATTRDSALSMKNLVNIGHQRFRTEVIGHVRANPGILEFKMTRALALSTRSVPGRKSRGLVDEK